MWISCITSSHVYAIQLQLIMSLCVLLSWKCTKCVIFSFCYRKMFVGGLSWESTQDTLQRYFGQYGEVIDCVVMKNSETGRSRGFGFVTFSDPSKVDLVLKSGPHELDGRTVSNRVTSACKWSSVVPCKWLWTNPRPCDRFAIHKHAMDFIFNEYTEYINYQIKYSLDALFVALAKFWYVSLYLNFGMISNILVLNSSILYASFI